MDLPELIDKVRAINAGREEIFKPATVRDHGLIMSDWKLFGNWLLQQREVTTKRINQELLLLGLRRWAIWHVMAAPKELIPLAKSMFLCT